VSEKIAPTNVERIDYYEKELIDMKIRLDAMELDGETFTKPDLPTKKVKSFDMPEMEEPEFVAPKPMVSPRVPNMSFEDSVTFVLKKITEGPMTSRDIEVMFGKSREHVSRLMKKLFEDGFVGRDASARPYRYTITEKGRERIGSSKGSVVEPLSVSL
jgi:predicted transcriptional regulator